MMDMHNSVVSFCDAPIDSQPSLQRPACLWGQLPVSGAGWSSLLLGQLAPGPGTWPAFADGSQPRANHN